jgi:putative ABC transport system permease protein
MMSIWRTFYIDVGAPDSAKRVITRDRVSLAFLLPGYYRDKIRSIRGVVAVAPMTWFGGKYKDDRPENFFAQIATDPDEYLKVASDKILPADQVVAWQRDRAGALVDVTLADKYGWKIGDKITLQGTIFPANPELTIRGIYHRDPPQNALYFNAKYLEESVDWFKGRAGWYSTQLASPADVARVSGEIDDIFRNSPERTKTESEKAFQLSFVATLGNVTREVAVLKTLGFTRRRVLSLFVFEAVALAVSGGLVGIFGAAGLIHWMTHSTVAIGIPINMKVTLPTIALSLLVAATVGFLSGYVPAYGASRTNIVEGLRHIG